MWTSRRASGVLAGLLAGSLVVGSTMVPGLAAAEERAKAPQTTSASASPSAGASPRKISPYAKANRMGAPRPENRTRSLTATRPGQQSGRGRPRQTR